ncbi:MAG: small basic protein [Candidatus Omnitrophica bacterium]|nr:small basic protein [Candidatus Omnitrophota bacterium]
MSQHPSLLGSQKGKQHRSVLKRYERLKHLIEKGEWVEEKDSIYSLPKIKSVRFKVKKEKAPQAEAETTVAKTPPSAQGGGAGVKAPAAQFQSGGAKLGSEKSVPQKDKKTKT